MRKSVHAFTLIELLVVITIIAILAALIFPVFAQAKRAAKTTTTLSNAKQLATAFALYQSDHDDGLPPSTEGLAGEGMDGGWIYNGQFGNYQAGRFDPLRGVVGPYAKSKGVYVSGNDPDGNQSGNSFAFNGCLLAAPFQYGINPSLNASAVLDPAGTMLLGEEGTNPDSDYERGTNDGFFHPIFDNFATWHAGKTVILHVDTHVKVRPARDQFRTVLGGAQCDAFWPAGL